jgi:hypothetical protein
MAAKSTKPAKWVGVRDVVTVIDGPLAGRWYFATGPGSWAELVASAEAMASTRPTRDAVLDYVLEPRRRFAHPVEDVRGAGLSYRPSSSDTPAKIHSANP